eukprot:scaffold8130_cov164-Amphora_coffeaeformis.AAC.5
MMKRESTLTSTAAVALTTAVFLLATPSAALDVEISDYECDASYPVTANVYMECANGSGRCTFGELITVYVCYSDVENSGISGDVGYLSADLSLFSIDFSLVSKQAVPLCYFEENYQDNGGEEEQADYNGEQNVYDNNNNGRRFLDGAVDYGNCPADGCYPFSVEYVLPSAGNDSAAWLASGWQGTGTIEMFAQRNDQYKIGMCSLTLNTFVTKEDSSSLLSAPSAAATAGIILAIILATVLMCCYCYCCIRSRKTKKESLEAGDDVTSNFRRLDEDSDLHSKPGVISIDAKSQASSKKSAKEMTVFPQKECGCPVLCRLVRGGRVVLVLAAFVPLEQNYVEPAGPAAMESAPPRICICDVWS